MNSRLWVYLAEKMPMIWHNLDGRDFCIVFCWHPDFLVLAYIPMPKGRGFTLDLVRIGDAEVPC